MNEVLNNELDASRVLAAALKQMDEIINGPNGDSNNKLLDCPDNQQWSSTADVVFFIKSVKCALEKSEVSDGNGNRTNHPHEGIDQETLLFLSKWLRNELLSRTSQSSDHSSKW
ncbi:uncharacterized protein TNIN_140081 [Trichonephila inaurata madagascariensis]|uniref:Uncharacterized protein n=1 Tax=Trichonephila inaurata madagascariensis TaxID=2747483 RepID=A0A8X6XUK9_9ARAC|nr:uncharacterized protein TNIN_140081 [Trichonephila inaurata madagascariensis]